MCNLSRDTTPTTTAQEGTHDYTPQWMIDNKIVRDRDGQEIRIGDTVEFPAINFRADIAELRPADSPSGHHIVIVERNDGRNPEFFACNARVLAERAAR